MTTTLTMPETGTTVRTETQRRFVLVGESRVEPGEAWVVKRSDNKEILQQERAKRRARAHDFRFIIFDTTTGEWV